MFCEKLTRAYYMMMTEVEMEVSNSIQICRSMAKYFIASSASWLFSKQKYDSGRQEIQWDISV